MRMLVLASASWQRASRQKIHCIEIRHLDPIPILGKPSNALREGLAIESRIDPPVPLLLESPNWTTAGDDARAVASVEVERGKAHVQDGPFAACAVDSALTMPFLIDSGTVSINWTNADVCVNAAFQKA